jgi:LacI family transcriptional regulator
MNVVLIAKKARVSTATVSRTLNNSPLVREATAARVREVIKELGYIPNGSARSLSSGRSNLLGMVISDITNPFFPDLISSFEQLSDKESYEVIIANTNYDPARLEHCLQRMMERRVDGIALMTSEMHTGALELLKRQSIPVVMLQNSLDVGSIDTVRVDYGVGIRAAVKHLVELGHKDIAFIAGPKTLWTANRRREFWLAEVRRNKLKLAPEYLIEGDHRVEGGAAAMRQLLKLTHRPTAILCSNDLTALGAQKAINEAGLTVPGDFSLIGYDDLEIVSLMHPALTTVCVPRAEIAKKALMLLMAGIRKEAPTPSDSAVQTYLTIRESTAPPRKKVRK